MPHYEFLLLTSTPDLIIVVTDRVGSFHFVDSYVVCEVRQIDQICEQIYGPFPLSEAIERAQQAVREIYYIDSALPNDGVV